MAPPNTWEELLHGPVYVINLERQPARLQRCMERAHMAGFTNVIRWDAFDASAATKDELREAWNLHGSPKFDVSDGPFVTHVAKQGIALSHLNVWKHIANSDAPWGVVLEDDVVFHKDWNELGPLYFNATPKDYGACYIGHYCAVNSPYNILKVPVYCDHAKIITKEGAAQLYEKVIRNPNGLRTIDCLVNTCMSRSLLYPDSEEPSLCNWYVWNAKMFPDHSCKITPDHVKHVGDGDVDVGLVFQQDNI